MSAGDVLAVAPPRRSPVLKAVYATLGLIFLGIGFAGYFIPGLPGTVFLLIAAWFFSMSNERLYNWMVTNRYFGKTIADYRAGLGIPRKIKVVAITSIVVVVPLSVIFGIDAWWLRASVILLGIIGIWFIITRPTTELISTDETASA